MATPFPDMDYWGSFMAMGPAPLGDVSNPPDYGKDPLTTGPYKIDSFRPQEELVLSRNDQWNPDSDPARHQYADGFVFKFNADQAQTDEIMLSGNTESQTSLATGIGSDNYTQFDSELGDRLVQQGAQCISTLTPDYTKITDINVRKALAWAYPYESIWLAGGEVPGVTRIPANGYMPPGMAGKPEYFADGEQFVFNPERSKELLAEAGYEPGEYEITMIYSEETLDVGRPEAARQGLGRGRLQGDGHSDPGHRVAVQHLAGPRQQDQQDAQHARRQLVLRLAVGLHDDPAAAQDGRGLQHRLLQRAVDRRRDGRHRDDAARGAG